DASGQRILARDYDAADKVTDRYYFFPEYELTVKADSPTQAEVYYFWNGERILKRNPHKTDDVFVYAKDLLGSTRHVYETGPNSYWNTEYDPYGYRNLDEGTAAGDMPKPKYAFNDKDALEGLGLYYYGARYYDPGIGRFITPDSVMTGLDSQALNPYSYCENNPTSLIDPDGHAIDNPAQNDSVMALRYKDNMRASIITGIMALKTGALGPREAISLYRQKLPQKLNDLYPDQAGQSNNRHLAMGILLGKFYNDLPDGFTRAQKFAKLITAGQYQYGKMFKGGAYVDTSGAWAVEAGLMITHYFKDVDEKTGMDLLTLFDFDDGYAYANNFSYAQLFEPSFDENGDFLYPKRAGQTPMSGFEENAAQQQKGLDFFKWCRAHDITNARAALQNWKSWEKDRTSDRHNDTHFQNWQKVSGVDPWERKKP
ncbi:MAG: RHS repeat-associated core domain-containing protein, partial [Desulfobacteraceae bacterium]